MGNSSVKLNGQDEPSREFSLANKKLKLDSALDVEEYVSVVRKIKNLTVVTLSGNTIGVDAAKAFADALKTQKTLKEVDLHDCFTGRLKEEVPVAIEAFCKVFMSLPNLIKVDFSDNAFGPVGAKAVYEYLSNATSLQELKLNNNGLGPEGGKLIGEALVNCQLKSKTINRPSSLRRISIGRNRLENGSSESLGKAFEAHELLEEISLYQNGIRPDGIKTLVKSLSKCSHLSYLDLQDNTFTDSAAREFSTVISCLNKLTHLNLGDCMLGAEGSLLVVQALFAGDKPSSKNLKYLNLQFNEMTDDGALEIAKNVSFLSSIEKLFLNGNNFKSKGVSATAIKKAFDEAHKTHVLDEWDEMEADLESDSESELEEESESGSEKDEVEDGEDVLDNVPRSPSPNQEQDKLVDSIKALNISN
jgi:Ran GTPase-activating protein 1